MKDEKKMTSLRHRVFNAVFIVGICMSFSCSLMSYFLGLGKVAIMVLLLAFNLAPIRTYKFGAKWFYVLVAYTIIISTYFAWLQ